MDDLLLDCTNKDWDMKHLIGLPDSILFNCFWQQASIPLEKMHMSRSANSQPPSSNISFSSNWKCEECGYLGFLCQFLKKIKIKISNFNYTDVIDPSLDCQKKISIHKIAGNHNLQKMHFDLTLTTFKFLLKLLWGFLNYGVLCNQKNISLFFVDPYNLQLYQSSFTPCVTHFTKCTNSNAYAQNILWTYKNIPRIYPKCENIFELHAARHYQWRSTFFFSFLCFHTIFNNSSLFMSMSN